MKIAVLCGGLSTERDVSIVSGQNVAKALRKKGHSVFLLDAYMGHGKAGDDMSGIFESGEQGLDADKKYPPMESLDAVRSARAGEDSGFFGPNVLAICAQADVVFLALHGANGEDGRIQAAFDLLGIKYTGCGHLGSAVAMNKVLTRRILINAGIPMAKGFELIAGGEEKLPEECGLSYPVVVKPSESGSSIGVSIANDRGEYMKAVRSAFELDDEIVVEQYIPGREFDVAVLGDEALPVIEIAPKQGFYDYKNKYSAGLTVETCPAEIPDELTEKLQRLSLEVFRALGLSSYARMDFRVDGSGNAFCLEANTLPGMTPTSLLPQEAAAAGIDFPELCERIIELAYQ